MGIETKRRLKKIGGSVALFISPEMLEELGMEPGSKVEAVSEGGGIRVRSAEPRPPDELIEFVHRFASKYEEALRNLSHR